MALTGSWKGRGRTGEGWTTLALLCYLALLSKLTHRGSVSRETGTQREIPPGAFFLAVGHPKAHYSPRGESLLTPPAGATW